MPKKNNTRISKEQAKQILKAYDVKTAEDVQYAVKDLMKEVLQTALEAEIDSTLGYSKHDTANKTTTNCRNGSYKKGVRSTFGNIDLDIPRDRNSEHEPHIVKKGMKDISNLQQRIISMYGRGMSQRDIQAHMEEIYGIDVSAEMISKVTDAIVPKIQEWQSRTLQSVYTIVYMDAIHFKVREDGRTINKAIYLAMGIDCDGMKDVLGIWIGENESSKYWLNVLSELKNRGVQDILVTCIDGLTGFEKAIHTVFPKTDIQRCIVHQIRYCCRFVSYKDRKEFCADMKQIYSAPSEELALQNLDNFKEKWGKPYHYAVKSWEDNWGSLSSFFKYPDEIRRLIYTTNPIESLNSSIRKVAGPKRIFPTNQSAIKSVFLAVENHTKKWTVRTRNWSSIFNQLSIHFSERLENFYG